MDITNITQNQILNSDSYKFSHWPLYPEDFESLFAYLESRGGEFKKILFFGNQIFMKDYLTKPITQFMIDQAEEFISLHMRPGIFNRAGWQHILNKHGGYYPIRVKAVPEGKIIPVSNALLTVEPTDEAVPWIASWVETQYMRGVWYPTTVATLDYHIKLIIKKYLELTADNLDSIGFGLLDFSARGCTSLEQNMIGAPAHLVNFLGTDSVMGVAKAMEIYNCAMPGFSVMATEHSVMSAYGRENELHSLERILNVAAPNSIVSIVIDTWNCYEAVQKLVQLRHIMIEKNITLVVRPDSGDPTEVLPEIYEILVRGFGYRLNQKGYRILNNVKVLWGDGINYYSVADILVCVMELGYSTETIMLGSGGGLMQSVTRDTQKMAYKASAAKINGIWKGIGKDPITDPGKTSKKGRLMLYHDKILDSYFTDRENYTDEGRQLEEMLQLVYENGEILKEYNFDEIRKNAVC